MKVNPCKKHPESRVYADGTCVTCKREYQRHYYHNHPRVIEKAHVPSEQHGTDGLTCNRCRAKFGTVRELYLHKQQQYGGRPEDSTIGSSLGRHLENSHA